MAKLKIIDGPGAGTEFILEGKNSRIGRQAGCAVRLPDSKTSRTHADVFLDPAGRYCLVDLGSSNGTRLNDARIPRHKPRPLSSGDILRIGRNRLRFFADEGGLPDIDIPGYVLEDILAEGGMGSIYRARDRRTGQAAAIKVLHPAYAGQEEFVGRFIQEARAAARLAHPNIVKVYKVGRTSNGSYYFSMELIRGTTLGHCGGELSVPDAAGIFIGIADALDYAHRRGIIHRDIKPDNIMLDPDGEPKIMDLGIAILDRREISQTGRRVLGTPHYMSPEQASGKNVTAATDIYSLGATFYFVFSGRPPFDAGTPEAIMVKHVREAPQPLSEAAPGVPPEIAGIIDRALSKDPGRRQPTAGKLRNSMIKALRKSHPPAPGRDRGLLAGLAALIGLALLIGWLVFR
ncbi:MAG: protein kinase [Planctomycetota bacterium]|jgi:serine/threonine protein kinase|nr:protein kinase [Planctomycetota bacterium]